MGDRRGNRGSDGKGDVGATRRSSDLLLVTETGVRKVISKFVRVENFCAGSYAGF